MHFGRTIVGQESARLSFYTHGQGSLRLSSLLASERGAAMHWSREVGRGAETLARIGARPLGRSARGLEVVPGDQRPTKVLFEYLEIVTYLH